MRNSEEDKSFNIPSFECNNTDKIPSELEFSIFKKKISSYINLDLTNYKSTQMERRIASLMNRNRIDNLQAYYKLLTEDSAKLNEFVNMLTINVSEFFRNCEKFKELETKYLPDLLKKENRLKIWSAGCSIGAEIYSIAMLLDKVGALDRCELLATDFDQNILKKAKTGIYTRLEHETVPREYRHCFHPIAPLTNQEEERYQINPKFTSKIRFERQDLLNDKFERNFDLVLCRNVVIYFTEEAKDVLYKKFRDSLKSGGIMFIGSTERINNHKNFGYNLLTSFFYEAV
jgi:chemotaxis protein methyltransferase CheR